VRIGIVGTGKMADGLGRQLAAKGHHVMYGSRDPNKSSKVTDASPSADVRTTNEAASFGEVVAFVVPGVVVLDAVNAAGSLTGKTVIDCTNPIQWAPGGPQLGFGEATSAAEEIAKVAPGAIVIKAFNTNFAQLTLAGGEVRGQKADSFYCGDDSSAKETVAQLARDVGFEPVDVGALNMARFLEAYAVILIQLMRRPDGSRNMGYKILRP
jgi:predicted dinucleotide-binding enzyme